MEFACHRGRELLVINMNKIFIAALCFALASCAQYAGKPTPVINKSPYRVIPETTQVGAGESIYSIAWKFGLDFQKIAKWNGLAKPYKVQVGQDLRLRAAGSDDATTTPAVTVAATQVAPKATPKPVPEPVAEPIPEPIPQAATEPVATPSAAGAPTAWSWPANGDVVGKFSRAKGQNGIQIAGADGSPIRATAGGEVVYAGEGLRGYGKLIIVKHSSSYLSAYAHNRAILVAEGEQIKSGQQIAKMGASGADRTMLHFEIRQDGQPVDPLKFLR